MLEAREIAAETGEVPSQRYLKTALNIGGARAKLVRDKLVAETEPVPEVPEPVLAEPGDEIALGALDAPTETSSRRSHKLATWPLVLLAIPAFVAVWSGWVGLGELAGFEWSTRSLVSRMASASTQRSPCRSVWRRMGRSPSEHG
ncbi:hypothetical protein ACFQX6_40125 [Streptosporangium lutulentum]